MGSFFVDGVHLCQVYKAITRRQFTFCHKSQGVPDTQFIDLGRMKG